MFLLILACLAFVSIALPDAMLGVAWPSMRLSFDQPTGAAGLVPPVGVAATLVSTVTAGHLVRRLGHGRLLAVGTLLSTLALVLAASSTTFWHFLISVALIGLASGAIDVTLNAYATRFFGPRQISLVHASFGLGAAAAPLLVTGVLWLGQSWRLAYAVIAVLQLLLTAVFTLTRDRWHQVGPQVRSEEPVRSGGASGVPGGSRREHEGRRREPAGTRGVEDRGRKGYARAAWAGVLAAGVHTGIESAVALWAFVFLTEGAGVSAPMAGGIASGFWMMLSGGRVVLGLVAARVGTWPVMGLGVAGLVVAGALSLVPVPGAAVAAVLLFGLASAPVFPMLMLTTAERVGSERAEPVVGWQAAASSLGAATVPALAGLAIGFSATALAPVLSLLCLVAGILHLVMRRLR